MLTGTVASVIFNLRKQNILDQHNDRRDTVGNAIVLREDSLLEPLYKAVDVIDSLGLVNNDGQLSLKSDENIDLESTLKTLADDKFLSNPDNVRYLSQNHSLMTKLFAVAAENRDANIQDLAGQAVSKIFVYSRENTLFSQDKVDLVNNYLEALTANESEREQKIAKFLVKLSHQEGDFKENFDKFFRSIEKNIGSTSKNALATLMTNQNIFAEMSQIMTNPQARISTLLTMADEAPSSSESKKLIADAEAIANASAEIAISEMNIDDVDFKRVVSNCIKATDTEAINRSYAAYAKFIDTNLITPQLESENKEKLLGMIVSTAEQLQGFAVEGEDLSIDVSASTASKLDLASVLGPQFNATTNTILINAESMEKLNSLKETLHQESKAYVRQAKQYSDAVYNATEKLSFVKSDGEHANGAMSLFLDKFALNKRQEASGGNFFTDYLNESDASAKLSAQRNEELAMNTQERELAETLQVSLATHIDMHNTANGSQDYKLINIVARDILDANKISRLAFTDSDAETLQNLQTEITSVKAKVPVSISLSKSLNDWITDSTSISNQEKLNIIRTTSDAEMKANLQRLFNLEIKEDLSYLQLLKNSINTSREIQNEFNAHPAIDTLTDAKKKNTLYKAVALGEDYMKTIGKSFDTLREVALKRDDYVSSDAEVLDSYANTLAIHYSFLVGGPASITQFSKANHDEALDRFQSQVVTSPKIAKRNLQTSSGASVSLLKTFMEKVLNMMNLFREWKT